MEVLTKQEWNSLLDSYLIEGKVDIDLYQKTDEYQKYCLNEIKKSLARIEDK